MDYRSKVRKHGAMVTILMALLAIVGDAMGTENGGFVCLPQEGELDPVYSGVPNIESAVIRLRIYVIRNDFGGGGATNAEVDSLIAHTRADYEKYNIHFEVARQDLNCSACLTAPPLSPFDLMEAYGTEIGAAVFPAPASWSFSAGYTYQTLPATKCWVGLKPGSFDGGLLSHEIGHCLGLYHTFHSEFCNGEEGPLQCADCGDLVCDTVIDTFGDALREHVDKGTCEFDPGQYAPDPAPTGDPINIMAYSWPSCMTTFTNGQVQRMLYFIENSTVLRDAVVVTSASTSARFDNQSDATDLAYDGTPYSSVILDYNADNKKDLFISMRDDLGSLQKQTQLSYSEVPQFTDRTEYDIATADKPQSGLRGVAAADYDNDGRVDLFAAAESNSRLYHNNNGTFADSASALGLAAFADSSYAGAWGDFDRDGQIDLYVCRGAGGGSDPTAANLSAVRGRLLRNDVRASGSFADRSDCLGAASNSVGASVAASWADVEGDGDLDLFVGDLRNASGSALSRLYINNGAGGLSETFASRFSGLTVKNVNSVVWADMNNDAKLDLVLGSESTPPTVYFNNDTGNFNSKVPLSANVDAPTNGVRSVDFDLDGAQDILAVPRASTDHRWLFWNRGAGEGKQALVAVSHAVGFADSTGRIDGITMADFNSDGDSDIYFGRPADTGDFFYRAKLTTVDHPTAGWVGVRLVAGGGNNGSAIGARVRFIGSNFEQVQVVDGGSGKGGQADNVLICGLGSLSGTVSAEVKWSGGYMQTASLTRGQVTTITDETVPGEPDSVSGVYTALPEGQAEFTFTWDTPYSCKPSLDKVTITDRPRQPSQCPMGTVVLTPSSGNVTHTVLAKTSLAGGGYRHTLTWPLECRPPCSYNFIIESATDSTHKSQMEHTEEISMPVCISQ